MVIFEIAPFRCLKRPALVFTLAACATLVQSSRLRAQSTTAQTPPPGSLASAFQAEPSGEAFTLTFFNRPIVVLRARVLGRGPAERAAGAARILDNLVAEHITRPVEARPFGGGSLITVGSRGVMGLTRFDVEDLAGETLEGVTTQTVARLQRALDEAAEARRFKVLLRAAGVAAVQLLVGVLALWLLVKARRALTRTLDAYAERTVAKSNLADLDVLRASHLLDFQRRLVTTLAVGLGLIVTYATLTSVLRQFPYTRPWGESMSGFMLSTAQNLGLGIVNAIPGLFTVVLIGLIMRFVVRVVGLWFTAVEQRRVTPRWIHPETAQPTRRLVTTLLWLFAIVMAYPYLPGSQTDAFKGVSVLLGLMVTLGSSGFVNQVMAGFMLTFSRALRTGDFVRVGEVEGTVTHLGILSTKIRTPRFEEVTVPNAIVVAQTTTNFSRFGETEGVYTPTSVTIGYDAPWRQVQALLLMAAERTPGIRREPKPVVLQMALEDFYVKYTLFVCLEQQTARYITLHELHAHIQDLFNEYHVQIMSPNYIADPAAPKIVAKNDWFSAPASVDPRASGV